MFDQPKDNVVVSSAREGTCMTCGAKNVLVTHPPLPRCVDMKACDAHRAARGERCGPSRGLERVRSAPFAARRALRDDQRHRRPNAQQTKGLAMMRSDDPPPPAPAPAPNPIATAIAVAVITAACTTAATKLAEWGVETLRARMAPKKPERKK